MFSNSEIKSYLLTKYMGTSSANSAYRSKPKSWSKMNGRMPHRSLSCTSTLQFV